MNQEIPLEIDASTGTVKFEPWGVLIGRGFAETGMQALGELGFIRSEGINTERIGEEFVHYVVVYHETPIVLLGGRAVKLYFRFRAGLLLNIRISIVDLEWWNRKGHRENVALRDLLFPKGPKFKGGNARVWYETNTGALCDGGTNFSIEYDPP